MTLFLEYAAPGKVGVGVCTSGIIQTYAHINHSVWN